MYNLIIYDTSNFEDFPIGGQITSIRNFLRYVAEECAEICVQVLLVGVTNNAGQVGKVSEVEIANKNFTFLPILHRDRNLNNVVSSLRIEYLKALFVYRKKIPNTKNTLHYIHTPEAFIQIKLCHPFAKTAVFSHGSFFNMKRGFRFFQNNPLVSTIFESFLRWMLKKADLIFTLDEDSTRQYAKYNCNIFKVSNSIVMPSNPVERINTHEPIRLLFVGRLSKVKRIDGIIEAVSLHHGDVNLTILGDGEERENLETLIIEKKLHNQVRLLGSVSSYQVSCYMKESDILVMNSILEGKPMTILEAISNGLPVITTAVGGILELVEPSVNAEITDGSAEQIVSALHKINEHYSIYSQAALNRAYDFDYIMINRDIWNKLMRVVNLN